MRPCRRRGPRRQQRRDRPQAHDPRQARLLVHGRPRDPLQQHVQRQEQRPEQDLTQDRRLLRARAGIGLAWVAAATCRIPGIAPVLAVATCRTPAIGLVLAAATCRTPVIAPALAAATYRTPAIGLVLAAATCRTPAIGPGLGGGNLPNPGNRPGLGGGNNNGNTAINRPGLGNNSGNTAINRPNIGNNSGNTTISRPNIGTNSGNTIVNRPNNNVNVGINRPGGNINSGNNITINNVNKNVTNSVNNVNVNRPSWVNGNPNWAYRPGWSNHQSWVNGYWHGQNSSNWWGSGGAFATGLAVGGIGAWGIGSGVYNWGYRPYVNPYVVAQPIVMQQPASTVVVQQPVPVQQPASVAQAAPIDYSQPLNTSSPPPDPATADPAMQTFDAARAAFKAGNYAVALQQTDEVLKSLPSDAAINEFRALCLFALKRYDESAATLYAVLSAGPGWDWTTLSGLYPSVEVYTDQVHALEDYRTAQPQSAPARFVLAYHYLTQGHNEAAVEGLKEVVKLQPGDQLSAQLVAQLSGDNSKASPEVAAAPSPAPPAEAPATGAQGNLVGAWKASAAMGTSIELTLGGDSKFNWNVVTQGKTQPIAGTYAYENGILTLTQSESNAMIGKVTWQDEGHFKFQAMGGGTNDQGLVFSK